MAAMTRWTGPTILALFVLCCLALAAPCLAQETAVPGVAVSGNDDPNQTPGQDADQDGPIVPPEHREDALLMALGAVSGQGLMLTYSSIATLADSYVEDIYTPEEAADLAGDYLAMTDSVRQSLGFILHSGIVEGEDKELLERILAAYGFLRREIEAFGYFVETGNPDWVQVYEDNRDKAWDAIESLAP